MLGLIVNPIAGMGGSVALKGTDGVETLAEARRRGAVPVAGARAARALAVLAARRPGTRVLALAAPMGAALATEAGLAVTTIGAPRDPDATSAEDTRRAAAALLRARPGLIMFAGGDGTARDVFDVVADDVPVLGVPAGVKMHSAVFARDPAAAGELAARFLAGEAGAALREAEVMDIDEAAVRAGELSPRLHGFARTPHLRGCVQGAKTGAGLFDEAALEGACAEIARALAPGTVHLFGPGTTTRRILRRLGLEGTLLGVDAVLDGRPVGGDLTAAQCEAAIAGRPARIVVGVVGGQGCLFGRGNQPLSPRVIERVGRENIVVVAAMEKLAALADGLFVDTGDPALDARLAGFLRVHTGPGITSLVRVRAPAADTNPADTRRQTA